MASPRFSLFSRLSLFRVFAIKNRAPRRRRESEKLPWRKRVPHGICVGMKKTSSERSSSHPAEHCENLKRELGDLMDHLRRDVERVDEPQFKALCETAAEVLGG